MYYVYMLDYDCHFHDRKSQHNSLSHMTCSFCSFSVIMVVLCIERIYIMLSIYLPRGRKQEDCVPIALLSIAHRYKHANTHMALAHQRSYA